jgi:hypothetical protein
MKFMLSLIVVAVLVGVIGTNDTMLTLRQGRAEKTQSTAFALCVDVKPQAGKPVVIHGPYVVSPNGLHKAYANVSVELPDKEHQDEYDCRNHSTLFVAKELNGQFSAVLDVAGVDNSTRGNGFQIVDWSPDSDTLLADLITWYYGSDAIEHNLILYSPRTGVVRQKSLSALFKQVSHKDCMFDGQIKGFLADGRIALRANPTGEEGIIDCVQNVGFWALSPVDLKLTKISGDQQVKQNSHLENAK